jgi:hypothetical protein
MLERYGWIHGMLHLLLHRLQKRWGLWHMVKPPKEEDGSFESQLLCSRHGDTRLNNSFTLLGISTYTSSAEVPTPYVYPVAC